MTDLEDRIRAALADPRRELPPWPDPIPRIRRTARRQRASLAGGIAALTAILAAAIVGPATVLPAGHARPALGAHRNSLSAAPPQSPPGWVRHYDSQGTAGDFIDTPVGWHANRLSAVLSPNMLWAIGTGPVPAGHGCGPTAALRKLPKDGMLIVVLEYDPLQGPPYAFPPRAGRLTIGPLRGPMECWGVRTHLVLFEDGGRYFQIQTVFGPTATRSLRDEVQQSINTLHITPLAKSEQPATMCRAGKWTYCPQAAWVYVLLGRAGIGQLGSRGTQAIIGLAAHRSFAVWTSSRRPPSFAGCRDIAGARVCRSGTRLTWAAKGLWLLAVPAMSPYASLSTNPGLPRGPVLARLIRASLTVRSLP